MALVPVSESKAQLREYRTEIKDAHAEFEGGARTSIAAAKRIGAALAGAKAELEHGEFMPWVEKNCPFSCRTANAYMAVTKAIENSNSQSSANLLPGSIDGILKAIAPPKKVKNEAPPPAAGSLGGSRASAGPEDKPAPRPKPTKIEAAKPKGPEIPEHLEPVAEGAFVRDSVTTLNALVKRIKKESNSLYGPWISDLESIVEGLNHARNQIANLQFGQVCAECDGKGKKDCCRGTGWIPEWRRIEMEAGE